MWADNPYDRNSPTSDAPKKLANSYVATGYLRVYGFTVYNSLAAIQYLQMFDGTSVPADTAVPLMTFQLPAQQEKGVWYGDCGRIFRQGLVLCNSTTDTTKTIGSANCFFDVEYDYLYDGPSTYTEPDGG